MTRSEMGARFPQRLLAADRAKDRVARANAEEVAQGLTGACERAS